MTVKYLNIMTVMELHHNKPHEASCKETPIPLSLVQIFLNIFFLFLDMVFLIFVSLLNFSLYNSNLIVVPLLQKKAN